MSELLFKNGVDYNRVYFFRVDASGHSTIVENNPDDLVNKSFDLLEQAVYSAIDENCKIYGCEYARFWGWQGDGGLCVFYDHNESTTVQTAIHSAISILEDKLKELRNHFAKLKLKGQINLRISVHKGAFTYKGDEHHGSIHSKELNFVCHLESQTPKNCLTISEDVLLCCNNEMKKIFQPLDFEFEGKKVYVFSSTYSNNFHFEWIGNVNFHDSFKATVLSQRLSEQEKTKILSHAQSEVIDVGTTHRTCSYYLRSTQTTNLLQK